MHYEEIDYLVKLAADNVCKGVIQEPRMYWDTFDVPAAQTPVSGNPNVFVNGEKFPVRLTHLIAGIRFLDQADVTVMDERFIQRIGLRMTFHDQYYMQRIFAPLPLWANKPVAAADMISQGSTRWRFDAPFVLSTRDTVLVRAGLEQAVAVAAARTVSVGFTGVGMNSKRPYFLQTSAALNVVAPTSFPTDRCRNDGTEPIVIVEMTTHVGGVANGANPVGDSRAARFNMKQVGNGTNAEWITGPVGVDEVPGMLLGVDMGRAIVHYFPGDGLLWEPGEGITMDARALNTISNGSPAGVPQLAVALAGYITVT